MLTTLAFVQRRGGICVSVAVWVDDGIGAGSRWRCCRVCCLRPWRCPRGTPCFSLLCGGRVRWRYVHCVSGPPLNGRLVPSKELSPSVHLRCEHPRGRNRLQTSQPYFLPLCSYCWSTNRQHRTDRNTACRQHLFAQQQQHSQHLQLTCRVTHRRSGRRPPPSPRTCFMKS